MFNRSELEAAARQVHRHMSPTPQYAWPQLAARLGCEVVVKHENHTPTGAFKLRGALTFIDWLTRSQPDCPGIVTATRGNHGQGQAMAARAAGMRALVYVPHGNSVEKNAAMRAFGAELVEFGEDFDTARHEALRVGQAQGLHVVPAFHRELVRGVATYAYELFTARPDLDTVYVPIGCGSGICGTIIARDALGLSTKIVGVVSENAQTAKLSAESGRLVETDSARTFADGMAVRVPVQEALDIYATGAERIITVSDDEIAAAIRTYFTDIHNLAEGAGAAPLAGLMQEQQGMQGRKVGVILCGGNIDTAWMRQVLDGQTPTP
ncbi:threonine dehydratase [Oceaniglobus trochenteri]|uniref:threonine dehydratase n=1 Tax=Oceaniglobus trochenteri TaxID=2763260 RepID=UPI001CFF7C78|nr:threonine dehydratase [Oceaniglobus trochenteri]